MTYREVLKRLGIWTTAQRQTFKELALLTDKELADIGLNRGDVITLINEMEE